MVGLQWKNLFFAHATTTFSTVGCIESGCCALSSALQEKLMEGRKTCKLSCVKVKYITLCLVNNRSLKIAFAYQSVTDRSAAPSTTCFLRQNKKYLWRHAAYPFCVRPPQHGKCSPGGGSEFIKSNCLKNVARVEAQIPKRFKRSENKDIC